jgi:hypothetical protein
MSYTQTILPSPNIAAEEGMCLQYVRMTYGLPVRYGSATEAWLNSTSQHRDRNYPQGVWFPVWWALDKNVNGHVALVAPDGRVYSTSNLAPNPLKVHPNVADVEAYYARYGMTLTYRGWTEDVAGYPVIADGGISAQGSITTSEEDTMTPEQWKFVQAILTSLSDNVATKTDVYALKVWDQETDNSTGDRVINTLRADIGAMAPAVIADLIPDEIAAKVADLLAKRLAK